MNKSIQYYRFFFSSFVANLFNTYPALNLPDEKVIATDVVVEETREEKTYRNFINSFGIDPHVNYLYSDLSDGLVLLHVKFLYLLTRKKNNLFFSSMILFVRIQLIGRKYIKLLKQ